ncbi:MAG: hypothetical protein AAB349_00685, partial [Chloroflexota bacterium]
MSIRGPRSIRVVPEQKQRIEEAPFASTGRPPAERQPILWVPAVLRLFVLAWAAAIVAALVDEFGPVAHLPFLTAMGMTGLLVGATFLWTAREDGEFRKRQQQGEDDDAENDLLTDLPTFNHF